MQRHLLLHPMPSPPAALAPLGQPAKASEELLAAQLDGQYWPHPIHVELDARVPDQGSDWAKFLLLFLHRPAARRRRLRVIASP
jgi:hypothetical protein